MLLCTGELQLLLNYSEEKTEEQDAAAEKKTLVIGHDPENPHFFWLAGQGGYGFQTSAAASELASDMVLGKKSNLAYLKDKVSPKRFF